MPDGGHKALALCPPSLDQTNHVPECAQLDLARLRSYEASWALRESTAAPRCCQLLLAAAALLVVVVVVVL